MSSSRACIRGTRKLSAAEPKCITGVLNTVGAATESRHIVGNIFNQIKLFEPNVLNDWKVWNGLRYWLNDWNDWNCIVPLERFERLERASVFNRAPIRDVATLTSQVFGAQTRSRVDLAN